MKGMLENKIGLCHNQLGIATGMENAPIARSNNATVYLANDLASVSGYSDGEELVKEAAQWSDFSSNAGEI